MFDVLLHDIVVLSKEVQLELTYADLIPKESHDSSLPCSFRPIGHADRY